MLYVNSFGARFQTTFVVCFSFLTNYSYRLKRSYVKLKDSMSNSVDPDETAHMSRLIWIYTVCKSPLLSPMAMKELTERIHLVDFPPWKTTFMTSLFSFLHVKCLLKTVYSKRKEFAPTGSEFFIYSVDPFFRWKAYYFDRIASTLNLYRFLVLSYLYFNYITTNILF